MRKIEVIEVQAVKQRRDWFCIFVLYSLIAMMILAANLALRNYVQQGVTLRTVKAVCDIAHNEVNGSSENACGIAQDESNSEYLCKVHDYSSDCWVEAK